MGIPAIIERRNASRKKLSGLLPARLSVESTMVDISCKPVDVSDHGLGIITETHLAIGTLVVLHLPGSPLILEVKWSEQDFGRRDLKRYGLELKSGGESIARKFEEAGCLK